MKTVNLEVSLALPCLPSEIPVLKNVPCQVERNLRPLFSGKKKHTHEEVVSQIIKQF